MALIRLSQRGAEYTLAPGQNDLGLAEGMVLATIAAPSKAIVKLNDREIEQTWRPNEGIALCQFDLTNQIGYHRLTVRVAAVEEKFDFSTATAKATAAEIRKMAEICCRSYLNYQKQFTYLSKSGEVRKVHLPQVHFAWLRDRIPEIEGLIRDIGRRPAVELRRSFRTQARGGDVSIPETIRLLHERPELLDPGAGGPIHAAGQRYWPALVRSRVRNAEPRRIEHSQIAAFLRELANGCLSIADTVDAEVRSDVTGWQVRIASLRGIPVLRPYERPFGRQPSLSVATVVQQSDQRYKRLRQLRAEYLSDIAPSAAASDGVRGNVKDVWEIYQTFIAHVIGNALGLSYVSPHKELRMRDADGASMLGGEVSLYFDQKPPQKAVVSWRDASGRPALERPDVFILNLAKRTAILLDAKFRVDKDGKRAKSEDLLEMQGYLNSFDLKRGAIVYPGKGSLYPVTGGKFSITEFPLRASLFDDLGSVEAVHEYVRNGLAQLWTQLPT